MCFNQVTIVPPKNRKGKEEEEKNKKQQDTQRHTERRIHPSIYCRFMLVSWLYTQPYAADDARNEHLCVCAGVSLLLSIYFVHLVTSKLTAVKISFC